jgi:hypothetical protein
MSKKSIEERFSAKVDTSGACWIWKGAVGHSGYGVFRVGDSLQKAHRYSYTRTKGPIPDGFIIDHLCHTPACVNPAHLRAVTPKQNVENRKGAPSNSSTGVRGVRLCPDGRYRASVGHAGEYFHVGSFPTLQMAEAAVVAKRLELHTHNEVDRRTRYTMSNFITQAANASQVKDIWP